VPSSPPPDARGLVLLVEDDPSLLRAYARVLAQAGFSVVKSPSGRDAAAAMTNTRFDAVVSDINMPEMSGIQLLRWVRERDLDLPVVLITGDPAIETAIKAVEYGALRYLVKPVDKELLERTTAHAVLFRRVADLKRQALEHLGENAHQPADRAGLDVTFERALAAMWMAYQPIISWKDRAVAGYEALMRSSDPQLAHPPAIIDMALRLDRLVDMAARVRALVADNATTAPAEALLYINLHPRELFDESLYSSVSPLAAHAHRCVLEVTEREALDGTDIRERITQLRMMGFRIAVDDLGAGHAGLLSVAQLEPEIVKLDMALVRGIDKQPIKRNLVAAMVDGCRRMGINVIAEGVETTAERDALADVGCDLMQGYLFAKPAAPFVIPVW
jgi:EAL domain-containing protein (putative c-di-GMP-specific phosphodiesterase class I)